MEVDSAAGEKPADAGDVAQAAAMEVDAAGGPQPATAAAGEGAAAAPAAAPAEGATEEAAADEDDDDDPVVQECDVYLNRLSDPPDFVGEMHLLQYPMRPCYRPCGRPAELGGHRGSEDGMELTKVEIKKKARNLRMTYKLKAGANYDEQGVVAGMPSQHLHVLSSTTVPNTHCTYAVGVIHEGRLVLCPIRAVSQLRPDFERFDKARAQQAKGLDAAAAANAAEDPEAHARGDSSGGEGDDGEGGEGQQAGEPAPVRMEIVKADAGAVAKAKPQEQQALTSEEPWSKLVHIPYGTDDSNDVFSNHIAEPAVLAAEAERSGQTVLDNPKLQKLEFEQTFDQYLGLMCGQISSEKRLQERRQRRTEEEQKDGLSAAVLMKVPVERQVEMIVRQYGVLSYSKHLKRRLPPKTLRQHGSDANLIALLRKCAFYCHGMWVLNSEKAGFDDLARSARDLALFLLTNRRGVMTLDDYNKWRGALKLRSSVTEEIIKGICRVHRSPQGNVWKLKNLEEDEDFAQKFPQVAKECQEWWKEHRAVVIQDIQNRSKQKEDSSAEKEAIRLAKQILGPVRRELMDGALTLPELRRRIQRQYPQKEITDEVLQDVLGHNDLDAVKLPGRGETADLWLLRATGDSEADKFRNTVIQIFKQRDSATRADILSMYEEMHGEKCRMSSYKIRNMLREFAEKEDENSETFFMKGVLTNRR